MRNLATMMATVGVIIATSCSGTEASTGSEAPDQNVQVTLAPADSTAPEMVPRAPSADDHPATQAFERVVDALVAGASTSAQLEEFVDAADVRHAWLVSDLLRFVNDGPESDALVDGFAALTGVDIEPEPERSPWNTVTNLLIELDTPAPPDYRRLKGALFTAAEPRWAPFFDDPDATIDWRWISWGGVFIDDRPLGDEQPCRTRGCIPALDDPVLLASEEGDWLADDAIVFGVTEGDAAVAFPKNIMEVHEMVNITIGGRRFGIPYCTLCGSAQAFYLDDVAGIESIVLRTSGLLNRSNKVMYDLTTNSVFDTFTGAAVSGPLLDSEVVLDQNSVTVSTWGGWKADHPDTMIVANDGGIGRSYDDDPLDGRDDDGPIFPIGDVDERLGVHAAVLGVVLDDGTPVAFSVDELVGTLANDTDTIEFAGVTVRRDGSGFAASTNGTKLGSHESFWFAWSQFHPGTALWPNDA